MLRPALLFLPALLLYAASAAMGADDKPSKSPNPAGKDAKVAVDPVTEAVRQDILTQLRIAAIAFNDPEDQGEALSGIVGAFLKHGRVKDALIDFKVINTPLWKAHALVHFAGYERNKNGISKARGILRKASKLITDDIEGRDKGHVLSLISQRQAEYVDFAGARQTAKRIPEPFERVEKLLNLGRLQSGSPVAGIAKDARTTFLLAFAEAKEIPAGRAERVRLLLRVAQAMANHKQKPLAVKTLEYAYSYLHQVRIDEHTKLLASLAAAFVDAGNTVRAMNIVRSLKEDAQHGRTLASIARAIALNGSIEGAAPLFFLALQDLEAITDPLIKRNLLTHIVKEQTRAGRLADAFTAIGQIKEPKVQQKMMFAMGQVLLEINKPEEALKLVTYIPNVGMRAQLFAHAARHRAKLGDRAGAAQLLGKALAPTGVDPKPEMLIEAIPLVREVLTDIGKASNRKEILLQIADNLRIIPDKPLKVPVMTRIAHAEIREEKKEAAERSLSLAWRIAWFSKDQEVFPELLNKIARAQLDIGELLLAFDTAARIPDGFSEEPEISISRAQIRDLPKYKALTAVAIAAVTRGQGPLALRAARKISHPSGRANAYHQIALAIPIRAQEAKNTSKKGRSLLRTDSSNDRKP